MFIVSKRNFKVRRADDTSYLVKKDFAGDIPEDVFNSRLIQGAIRGGLIYAPETSKDKDVYKAETVAKEKEEAADIRPDANPEKPSEEPKESEGPEEPVQEGVKIGRAKSRK